MFYEFLCLAELACIFLLSKQLTRSLSGFLYSLKFGRKINVAVIALIFLPGTFIHELSHYLMAKFLFISTGRFTLLPKPEGNMIRMGSVEIARVGRIRQLLIGLAPVLSGLSILFFAFKFLLPNLPSFNYLFIGLFIYLVFTIANSMFSSRKDLEGAGLMLIIVFLIIAILYILNKQFLISLLVSTLSFMPVNYFQVAAIYLMIPLILDILTILVLRLLIRLFNK